MSSSLWTYLVSSRAGAHPAQRRLARLCFSALLGLSLSSAIGCGEESGEVSKVRLELIPLEGQEAILTEGQLVITPYDLDAQLAYSDVTFTLATRNGSIPPLPLGRWQFFLRGTGSSGSSFGVSAPFQVREAEAVLVKAQLGIAECPGANNGLLRGEQVDGGEGDLPGASAGVQLSPLPDGRVLVSGGADLAPDGSLAVVSNQLAVYDPRYGQFYALPITMSEPRAYHSATTLSDGSILIAGGYRASGVPSATAERIRLGVGGALISELVAGFGEARARHQATRLIDDTVLFSGGLGGGEQPLASTTRFFPLEGIFRPQGPMEVPRLAHSQSKLLQTQNPAVVMGGLSANGVVLDSVEAFTIDSQNQSRCAGNLSNTVTLSDTYGCFVPLEYPLPTPRWGHRVATFESYAELLVIGGFQGGSLSAPETPVGAVALLNSSFSFNLVGSLAVPRGEGSVATLKDGSVIYLGGRDSGGHLAQTTLIRPQFGGDRVISALMEPSACQLSEGRYQAAIAPLQGGAFLIAGGVLTGQEAGAPVYRNSRRADLVFSNLQNISEVFPEP